LVKTSNPPMAIPTLMEPVMKNETTMVSMVPTIRQEMVFSMCRS